jgi:kynurenine aminotransferase
MIIINTPHNPVGKVFTKKELEAIAAIAEEFNLLVMADEVVSQSFFYYRKPSTIILTQYDCLVFDGMEHVRFANLHGMWDRTITVGSAGSQHTCGPLEVYF